MLVNEIMTPSMDAVGPDLTLKETARKMREANVGSLPVWEKGELFGMITDRDICCRAVAEGRDPARTTVREVMSREIFENPTTLPLASRMGEIDSETWMLRPSLRRRTVSR